MPAMFIHCAAAMEHMYGLLLYVLEMFYHCYADGRLLGWHVLLEFFVSAGNGFVIHWEI